MKKIINRELVSFTENDIKKYSRMVNEYFKRKWRFVFVFLLVSCSVQNEINKDDFKSISNNFSASFYDKLDTIGNYDNRIITRSLLKELIDIDTINYSKPIKIEIKKETLFLKFEDSNKKQYVLKFLGEKHKKRFVFYTNYKTISFPLVLMSKEMKRYSIYLTSTDEIIFANKNENTGMLLFFGAGNSSGFEYQFKLLRDE
ncbi:hypothetical protein FIA58_012540 [Flavobacterium jejuense]|uniref:Lipoprotein n=1 Tax=Flavobacterium jejuense TaxID=1544455 RepID=A0ABX0ITG1_9FLAO|nr:hypothetical protein [Flavobacterium jejuense]NHN26506.1 hypothetical protein [Flavobacterium jejuense]